MAKVCIVYHSGYGHTKFQADHVLKGVKETPGVEALILTSDDAINNMTVLQDADCIIFGCPTYMGGPSAQFKTFIDAASKIWFKQGWKDKLAAGFTNSQGPSGDKQSTLMALMINAMQHGMIWVGTGLMVDGDINRLSSYSGIMAQSPQGSTQPIEADLKTAEAFGRRVAEATIRWARG
jgi:NAD(P)H dehydrogenase (quinone)